MIFADRVDAGRRLGAVLRDVDHAGDVVVVGLPRGGVVVAAEVARALDAALDVVVVRKVRAPHQPELAIGAVGEGGAVVHNDPAVRRLAISAERFAAAAVEALQQVERRARTLRGNRAQAPLAGREVIVVDDGIATGSTARVACEVVRALGARHVTLAAPVAPLGAKGRFADVADDVCFLATPRSFTAVGQFYADFTQVSDEVVTALLT